MHPRTTIRKGLSELLQRVAIDVTERPRFDLSYGRQGGRIADVRWSGLDAPGIGGAFSRANFADHEISGANYAHESISYSFVNAAGTARDLGAMDIMPDRSVGVWRVELWRTTDREGYEVNGSRLLRLY